MGFIRDRMATNAYKIEDFQCMGNPTELVTQRLLGQDYKEAFRDENKMCTIAVSITRATALAGSDRSMKDSMITHGWAIATAEGKKCRISEPGMVDRDRETNDSTRAERGRSVVILAILVYFAKSCDLQKGHMLILIDHQQALRSGICPRQGDGPFRHLADDYDLECWASFFEQDLKRNHNTILDYLHMYSYQEDPIKLMKLHPEINLVQAIHMAKHPSVHVKISIVCDREIERGHTLFQGKQTVNPIIPNEVGAVLEVEGKHVFRNTKEKISTSLTHRNFWDVWKSSSWASQFIK